MVAQAHEAYEAQEEIPELKGQGNVEIGTDNIGDDKGETNTDNDNGAPEDSQGINDKPAVESEDRDEVDEEEDVGHETGNPVPKVGGGSTHRSIYRDAAYLLFKKVLKTPRKYPYGPPLAVMVLMLERAPDHSITRIPEYGRRLWEKFSEKNPMAAGCLNQSILDCRSVDGYRFHPSTNDSALDRLSRNLLTVRSAVRRQHDADTERTLLGNAKRRKRDEDT
ncbi:hypothetical protein F5Y07DRAFT_394435 [Xylaria sp. FL0933]|nr:hypothetical protein F5Y07DRAFT_394435 [Xylaria sp. FL0933]